MTFTASGVLCRKYTYLYNEKFIDDYGHDGYRTIYGARADRKHCW